LIPYDGNGFSISDIEFTFPPIRPGGPEPFDVTLDLTDNPGPDLMGMIITFSYQHEAGHVGVSLDNVDFDGNIVPPEWETGYSTDPDNRKARIWLLALSPDDPPLAAGVEGLIATLTFTRTENIAGPTTFLGPAIFPPTQLPMVITSFYADDDTPPEERILIPRYVFVPPGDVTGDGVVNSADIIFLINFLFAGGPPPSGK
jgi:hypothetical protein